jgi:hypothetical protein
VSESRLPFLLAWVWVSLLLSREAWWN